MDAMCAAWRAYVYVAEAFGSVTPIRAPYVHIRPITAARFPSEVRGDAAAPQTLTNARLVRISEPSTAHTP